MYVCSSLLYYYVPYNNTVKTMKSEIRMRAIRSISVDCGYMFFDSPSYIYVNPYQLQKICTMFV